MPERPVADHPVPGGGKRVVIGHLDEAVPALAGETGTHIIADDA